MYLVGNTRGLSYFCPIIHSMIRFCHTLTSLSETTNFEARVCCCCCCRQATVIRVEDDLL